MTQASRTLEVFVPIKFTVRGGRKTIVGPQHQPPIRTRFDDSLAKAFARSFRWKTKLEDGTYATIEELAHALKMNVSYVRRIIRLSLLAPDIVEAALDGRTHLTVEDLTVPLPDDWNEQRRRLGLSADGAVRQ